MEQSPKLKQIKNEVEKTTKAQDKFRKEEDKVISECHKAEEAYYEAFINW